MKRDLFNQYYLQAKLVDVRTNEFFTHAGYFWLQLTQKQLNKMYDLLVQQGAEIKDGWIEVTSYLKIQKVL